MTTQTQILETRRIQKIKSLAASIAHEVRSPLSSIQSCCDIIRGNLEVTNENPNHAKHNLNEAMEFLELICVASQRGLSVVEMILYNVKEEKFDCNKFTILEISQVIDKALCEYPFENSEKKKLIFVNSNRNFHFFGDETLMIYILFNLIKNSLYYKAQIEIRLTSGKRNNYLYFKDNGIGISKTQLPNIFDDFFTSNKKSGTGLGLPFCKRVMQAFGGDISCKSEEGEGVEFCLRFPIK